MFKRFGLTPVLRRDRALECQRAEMITSGSATEVAGGMNAKTRMSS